MPLRIQLNILFSILALFFVAQAEGQNIQLDVESNVPNFQLKILTTKDITLEKGTTSAAFSSGQRKIITLIETIASSSDGTLSIQLPAAYFEKPFRDSIFLTAPGLAPIRSPKLKTNKVFQAQFSPYGDPTGIRWLAYPRRFSLPCIEESAPDRYTYNKQCILQDTLTKWAHEPFNYQSSTYEIENYQVYFQAYQPVFSNIQASEQAKTQYSNGSYGGYDAIRRNAGIEYVREAILPLIRAMWDTQPYLAAFRWTDDSSYGSNNSQFLNYFKCLRPDQYQYTTSGGINTISRIDCRGTQPPQWNQRWQWQLTPPAPNYQNDPYSNLIDSIREKSQSEISEHPVAQHLNLTAFLGTLETYSIWSSMSLEDLQQECWTDLANRRPKCELLDRDRDFWTTLDQLVYLDLVQHKMKAAESQPVVIKWDQFSCFNSSSNNPALSSLSDYYYFDLANEIIHANLNQFLTSTDSIADLLAVIGEYQNARESYYSGRSSTTLDIDLRLDSTNASEFWKALEFKLNHKNWAFKQTYPLLSVEITVEDPGFRDILKTDYRLEHKELLELLNSHYLSSRPELLCGELAKTILEEYNIEEGALRQFNCVDISQLPEIRFSTPSSVRVSQSNQVITLTDSAVFRLNEARMQFVESFMDLGMSENGPYLNSSDLFPIIDKEAPHSARLIALQGDDVKDLLPGDYPTAATFFNQGDSVYLGLIRAHSNPSPSTVLDIDAAEWNQSLSKGRINTSITNHLSGYSWDGTSNAHLTIFKKEGEIEPLLLYEARRIQSSKMWNSLDDNDSEDKDFIQSFGTLRNDICNLILLTEDLSLNQHLLRELGAQNLVIFVPTTTMDSLRSTTVNLSRKINEYADSYASRKAEAKRAQEQEAEEEAQRRQEARAELERNFSRWKSSNQVYANPDGYYSCESVSGTLKIEYNRWLFEGISQFYTTEYASGTFEKSGKSVGKLGTLRVIDDGYDVGWGGSLNLELDSEDYPSGRNGWVLYVVFDGHPLVSRSICYKQ